MELKQLYELFENKYGQEVKPYIEKHILRNSFSEPVYYILDNFQLRRFRSAFPLIFAEEYKTDKSKVLPIAAASELIFTVALVQDDIIDQDNKRGEIPASHIRFGSEICLTSCDYVHSLTSKMLNSLRDMKISRKISDKVSDAFIDANRRLYQSFMAEKLEAGNFSLPMEKIIEVYKDKTIQGTTSLFTSTLVCTEDEETAELIKEYSYNLAIAGQIKNDIYDATSYLQNRGYSDLENGYVTYVIRKLLDSVSGEEKRELIDKLKRKDDDTIIKELKKRGIIRSCIIDCERYVTTAISRIKGKFSGNLEEILISWAEGNRRFSRQI